MKIKFLIIIFLSFLVITAKAQTNKLSKQQIQDDLEFLRENLNDKSSYVYLNGYDFNRDFDNYLKTIRT